MAAFVVLHLFNVREARANEASAQCGGSTGLQAREKHSRNKGASAPAFRYHPVMHRPRNTFARIFLMRPRKSGPSLPSSVFIFLVTFLTLAQFSLSQSLGNDGGKNQVSAKEAAPNSNPLKVKLRLVDTVSSADAKVGQIVPLEVVDVIQVDGKVIVAVGAHARATVTTAKRRGHNRREGQLVLTIQSVSLVEGKDVPLQSATLQKGSGHGPPIFGPCTFPLPADPAGLFRKGNDVVIPKGTELTAVIVVGNF
jgi:hypothetical protein